MKRLLVIVEGAADTPQTDLEGATPLELVRGVHLSALAGAGSTGFLQWEDEEASVRYEYLLATLLGMARSEARVVRRGPVEAAALPVDPDRWTYAYRGNFVTLDEGSVRESRVSGLSHDETGWLVDALRKDVKDECVILEPVADARLLVLFDRLAGDVDPGRFPYVGQRFPDEPERPRKHESDAERFMARTVKTLAGASLNEVRVDLGENPASILWLWGGGPPVAVSPPFGGPGHRAAMVTNSPLARGMAALCGLDQVELGDPWAEAAQPELIEVGALKKCIDDHDLTVLYVESPLEGGSFGSAVEKVRLLDRLDIQVLGRVRKAVEGIADVRLMVAAWPEEGVYLEETPVLLSGRQVAADATERWDEASCARGALGVVAAEHGLKTLIGE